MSTYKNLYFKLFNQISDTITQLQKIQQETEEEYISQETIIQIKNKDEDETIPLL